MQIQDWLIIVATLVGPIVAVQVTRHLDKQKETRDRKLIIFKTLMATRQYNLSMEHVQSLNSIDLEFSSKKKSEKDVIDQSVL
jgi:hypothetical protein